MPTINWFARYDSATANNTTVNVQPDAAIELVFATDGDGDGIPDFIDDSDTDGTVDEVDPDSPNGNLILDQPSSDPNNLQPDPNTLVSYDGGATWHRFVFITEGTVPANKNPANEPISLIRVLDDPGDLENGGTRFVFGSDDGSQAYADGISNGAINIGNLNTDPEPLCFTAGTMIDTPDGPRAVETLRAGDMVTTRDGGARPLAWTGTRTMTVADRHAPVRIAANALGEHGELVVSPQHRILLADWRADLLFGAADVLVAAKHLVNGDTICQLPGGEVTYVHICFDAHEIVFANGLAAESFHVGAHALDTLEEAAREEILEIFPELAAESGGAVTARPVLKAHEARLLARRIG